MLEWTFLMKTESENVYFICLWWDIMLDVLKNSTFCFQFCQLRLGKWFKSAHRPRRHISISALHSVSITINLDGRGNSLWPLINTLVSTLGLITSNFLSVFQAQLVAVALLEFMIFWCAHWVFFHRRVFAEKIVKLSSEWS